jgi:hypothetical protein
MPVVGFKNKFKNFKPLEGEEYLVKFDMRYSNHGSLINKLNQMTYDMGDLRMKVESVFDKFDKEEFYQYDCGIMILSTCRYLVDNIEGIYEIDVESLGCRDTYKREEIIKDYNKIKGE